MTKKKNLISTIDAIARNTKVKEGENQHEVDLQILPLKEIKTAKRCGLQKVANLLGCTQEEAIFFSVIFYQQLKQAENNVDIQELADHFGVSVIEILNYHHVLKKLKDKKLIRQEQKRRMKKAKGKRRLELIDREMHIAPEAYEAVIKGQEFAEVTKFPEMNLFDFLENAEELIRDFDDGGLSENDFRDEMLELIVANREKELPFIQRVDDLSLMMDDAILLFHVCFEVANGYSSVDLVRASNMINSTLSLQLDMRRRMVNGRSKLIRKNILKLEQGNFHNDKEITLTEKGMEYLFEDDENILRLTRDNKDDKVLYSADDIKEEKLFFNEREKERLNFLESICREEQYREVINRMKEQGMTAGMTILFHGEPGTGKTESVYQMARKTGRSIMPVEISSVRTKWYGESQKLLKQVFQNYHKKRASQRLAPILLFNEADAIFHKRIEKTQQSTDQTENALQNILLQELEDFEGILIATTNLTNRLDKAFERRFLYKLRFDKPSVSVKQSIWQSKIPKLTKRQAEHLAATYELSGGQIDNVARKYLMQEILHGLKPNLEELKQYCEEEHLNDAKTSAIGFGVKRAG